MNKIATHDVFAVELPFNAFVLYNVVQAVVLHSEGQILEEGLHAAPVCTRDHVADVGERQYYAHCFY
jgi:hypothetical protein